MLDSDLFSQAYNLVQLHLTHAAELAALLRHQLQLDSKK
jgi:hypothetical protein